MITNKRLPCGVAFCIVLREFFLVSIDLKYVFL